MIITNSNKYGTLSSNKLDQFEKNIDALLPQDYREFLLEHNGGKPDPCSFKLGSLGNDLQSFFGIHDDTYISIGANLEAYNGRIDKNILPIACDDFGNLICLGIGGLRKNNVYFWDHDYEGTSKCLTKLANGFTKFSEKLIYIEDDDEPLIIRLVEKNELGKIKILLLNGYELNSIVEYNRTVIEIAAIFNQGEIVKFLHNEGADLRASLTIAVDNLEMDEDYGELVTYLKSVSN